MLTEYTSCASLQEMKQNSRVHTLPTLSAESSIFNGVPIPTKLTKNSPKGFLNMSEQGIFQSYPQGFYRFSASQSTPRCWACLAVRRCRGVWRTTVPPCAHARADPRKQHNKTKKPLTFPFSKCLVASAFTLDFTINSPTALN